VLVFSDSDGLSFCLPLGGIKDVEEGIAPPSKLPDYTERQKV